MALHCVRRSTTKGKSMGYREKPMAKMPKTHPNACYDGNDGLTLHKPCYTPS